MADSSGSAMTMTTSDTAATLAEWREQEAERERTRYPFAKDEGSRCEVVRRLANPFNDETVIYRCGKQRGHDGRHACADEGWTVKWGA